MFFAVDSSISLDKYFLHFYGSEYSDSGSDIAFFPTSNPPTPQISSVLDTVSPSEIYY